MVAMVHAHNAPASRELRTAHALAGYAVVAAHLGLRFGTLALARPFALDLARAVRLPERPHLLALLYAGHAAETALLGTHHGRLIADGSPDFVTLREALAAHTGAIDARDTYRARLGALAIVRRAGNRAAIAALAERLAAGEMVGHLTARRIIRPAAMSLAGGIAAG